MTMFDVLKAPAWTCQWTCPYLGEVNRVRKQDLPLGLESPEALLRHLICHGCQMDLREIPHLQFVVHPTCPARIRPTKKLTIHLWPDDSSVGSREASRQPAANPG